MGKRNNLREHFEKVGARDRESELGEYSAPVKGDFPQCAPFPEDLTVVSYKKLGKLFSNYTAFFAFINERLAECKFEVAKLKIQRRRRRAVIVFSSGGIRMQKAAAVQKDPEYFSLTTKMLKASTNLNAYQSIMWTLKDYLRAIEYETGRRAQAMKGVG